jgi:hypothetical protein
VIDIDTIALEIFGQSYENLTDEKSEIKIVSYDSAKLTLEIATTIKLLKKDHKEIFVVSDLKFLVHNVYTLLVKKKSLELPKYNSKVTPTIPSYLNNEQQKALQAIFDHPLTYIWGAPGSGKTRAVLFESILNYIANQKQIIILAPTNSALEQILDGILPMLETLSVDISKVLRLGIASYEYAMSYPQTIFEQKEQKAYSTATLDIFEDEAPKRDLKSQIKSSLVVAATIDTFILLKLRGDIKQSYYHIFIDEAAFAPLIKVVSIVEENAPLTLLGDHKQFSPICEVSKEKIKESYENFFVWDKAAVSIGSIDSAEAFTKLQKEYMSAHEDMVFNNITQINLLQTHRYGQNLASILDKHIYQNGLTSLKSEPSNLFFAHAPNSSYKPLENEQEVEVCRLLYEELAHIGHEDVGIITPFNNQKRALQNALPQLRMQERILTFHKSQGREFETLIISPVFKHRYLSDSTNQSAKEAINVAISRAKSNIIIVCDYHYWMRYEEQFLTDILRSAKPFNLNYFV